MLCVYNIVNLKKFHYVEFQSLWQVHGYGEVGSKVIISSTKEKDGTKLAMLQPQKSSTVILFLDLFKDVAKCL